MLSMACRNSAQRCWFQREFDPVGQICVGLNINDVLEQSIAAVLHMAHVGGRLAPGQVAVEGFGQIQS